MWDLIVSVPDHCLSFYIAKEQIDFSQIIASFSKGENGHKVPCVLILTV